MNTEEDYTVVYLIVKSSLNMSLGKIVAQTVHSFDGLNIDTNDYGFKEVINWANSNKRIVSLQASDKEFEKIKKEYPHCYVVVDAGLTEVPAGSETVIALFPQKKSERSKTLKRLRVLKDERIELLEKINHILFEIQDHDPEHNISCHPEYINESYLKLAHGVDEAIKIYSEYVSKKFNF